METNHEIKTNIFTKVKISYENFLVFLSFMDTFRSKRSQMFFIIGAVKISQCSELKRDSNTGVFL